jgi:DNA primase
MGLIPEEVIGEIRDRADIVAVIGQHVQLRKAGRNHKGLCPFHQERTPSFNVNGDKGFFFCFGCQKRGDVFTFLMEFEGKSFLEAAESLAATTGVTIPRDENPAAERQRSERSQLLRLCDLAARFYRHQLGGPGGERARAYLAARGVSEATADRFCLGYAPGEWRALADFFAEKQLPLDMAERAGLVIRQPRASGHYDRFRDRVMCPVVLANGEVVGFSGRLLGGNGEEAGAKYINSPEGPLYKKSRHLYGVHQARDSLRARRRAILVEGNFDVISLHQAGLTETVAPLGTSLTEEQATQLRRMVDHVVLLYDGDRAGRAATLKALETLVAADVEVRIAPLPAGEDPDSLIASRGAGALEELVGRSLDGVEYFIHEVWSATNASADSRAAALQEAAQVIKSIANPTKRDFVLGSFAAALRTDVGTLRQNLRRILREGAAGPPRRDPAPAPAPGAPEAKAPPPHRFELDILAILIDHPQLLATAEEHDVFSLLTDSRLRDMYSAAREGQSALSAAPADPEIARHVLAGTFADTDDPAHTLVGMVEHLRRVRVKTRLLSSRPSLDQDAERERLRDIITSRKQVD